MKKVMVESVHITVAVVDDKSKLSDSDLRASLYFLPNKPLLADLHSPLMSMTQEQLKVLKSFLDIVERLGPQLQEIVGKLYEES